MTDELTNTYLHWQIASVLLAIGFLSYTWSWWQEVNSFHDKRYVFTGVSMHVLWAVTWLLISLPLFITWYAWHTERMNTMRSLALQHPDGDVPLPSATERDTLLKVLDKLQPVPFWNLVGTSFGALVSFLLPVVEAIRK